MEQCAELRFSVYLNFIDFGKAFDIVNKGSIGMLCVGVIVIIEAINEAVKCFLLQRKTKADSAVVALILFYPLSLMSFMLPRLETWREL